jgi:GTP-sensing pleiotropic transcriptional regulator CodY
MRNHIVSLKEEEVPKEDHLVGEIFFLEEEEEVEEVELNVMLVERQGICLGNVMRGREKEEENHTFLKPRRMWKQRQQKEDMIL